MAPLAVLPRQAKSCEPQNLYGDPATVFFLAVSFGCISIFSLFVIFYMAMALGRASKKNQKHRQKERGLQPESKVCSSHTANNLNSAFTHQQAQALESRIQNDSLQKQLVQEHTQSPQRPLVPQEAANNPEPQPNNTAVNIPETVVEAAEDTQMRNSSESSVTGILKGTPLEFGPDHQPRGPNSIDPKALAAPDRLYDSETDATASSETDWAPVYRNTQQSPESSHAGHEDEDDNSPKGVEGKLEIVNSLAHGKM